MYKRQVSTSVESDKRHPDPTLTINGVWLHYRPVIRFLALTFNRQLTWNARMDDLTERCKSSLNTIRYISHMTWGANREVSLRLYTALVITRMYYGCVVYSSTRRSCLKKLDSIHNPEVRYTPGAFRTSCCLLYTSRCV